MSDADAAPPRARVRDLLRPSRLYAGIDARPTFVLPTLLLVASIFLYVRAALDVVVPELVPALLESTVVTQSELERDFRRAFLTGSVLLPLLWMPFAAAIAWIALRILRGRSPYPLVISLLAYSSLWIAMSFGVKAVIVLAGGVPDAPLNLGALLTSGAGPLKTILALTNPFVALAAIWTIRGLRSWGASVPAATVAGAAPWVFITLLFATLFRGDALAPASAPVPLDDWPTIHTGSVTLRTSPADSADGASLARALDDFAGRVARGSGLEPRPLRVHVYPDHATLEQAAGEQLPVLVTGSIRGTDLLYLEMPGRSAGVPRERGFRHSLRYVGLMQLAPVTTTAPRWFVEGVVHAAVFPGTPELQEEYVALLRRTGPPTLDRLNDPATYVTPDGALLARSLLDHLAFSHGPEVVERLLRDVVAGKDFRDALFEHTRWTAGELEAGWNEAGARLLQAPPAGPPAGPAPTDGN